MNFVNLIGHAAVNGHLDGTLPSQLFSVLVMKELARHKVCNPKRAWTTLSNQDWGLDKISEALARLAKTKGNEITPEKIHEVLLECIKLYSYTSTRGCGQ